MITPMPINLKARLDIADTLNRKRAKALRERIDNQHVELYETKTSVTTLKTYVNRLERDINALKTQQTIFEAVIFTASAIILLR